MEINIQYWTEYIHKKKMPHRRSFNFRIQFSFMIARAHEQSYMVLLQP